MSRQALEAYRAALARDYSRRFPRSAAYYARPDAALLDHTSHAIRWNEPFMPIVRRAEGAAILDLDGQRLVDFWQGHFANLLGHNPPLVRDALAEALGEGRGLQTGMVHEIEEEVAELVRRATGAEVVRLTTSGSLGTFYAALLARAATGRGVVLKVSGGWHGSQPFGLKGVSAQGRSFDHLESEGLSASTEGEILLTRFNDPDDLARAFASHGERIAAFILEPVLGAAGGIPASLAYLREARRLTERHGAALICDEIITGFRFRAGDLTSLYGVRPDLLVLGKVLGGGMPVAAVAGRRDLMRLCTRDSGRVKFEGGTYSAHELSLIGARTLLRHLAERGDSIYTDLAATGARLREGLSRLAATAGVPVAIPPPPPVVPGGSLVMVHPTRDVGPVPTSPEELTERRHRTIDERLLKATLLLCGLSTRSGLGAASTAHGPREVEAALVAWGEALDRLRAGGLI